MFDRDTICYTEGKHIKNITSINSILVNIDVVSRGYVKGASNPLSTASSLRPTRE